MSRRSCSAIAAVDAAIERAGEAGLGTPILVLALLVSLALLWHVAASDARAAEASAGPEPSSLGGFLILLVPFVIPVLLMACVFRRAQPAQADDEAFGDTTGFGEG